jgi:two-component system, OmpR family, sensor histidine kinase MprB
VPLRKRVSLAAGAAVAVAVACAVGVCYMVVRSQLRSQIDNELRNQARVTQLNYHALTDRLPGISASAGGPAPYVQVVSSDGSSLPVLGGLKLPEAKHASAVAAGTEPSFITDATVNGAHLRVFTFPLPGVVGDDGQAVAVQLARPLAPVDNVLSKLRLILLLLLFGGIALAVALARIGARRALAPLSEVSETAKTIGETDDLSLRLAVHADDEVGQLATRFNEMLEGLASSRAALDDSVRSQRQLVADASHELRTPVTSLRTNIEVLLAGGRLDEEDRRRLLADVVEQSEELSTLVSDLIEVARGDLPDDSMDDIRLDGIAEDCLARARRNAPDVEFLAELHPVLVTGSAERLSRALNNLLDNAARHTAPGTRVEMTVDASGVRVRDHGSGIGEDDLPYVFDRFYRGANSRARQGSGLGLAIVRQVAESHRGTVSAANAPDGGAIFTITLPGELVSPDHPDVDPDDIAPYDAGGLVTRA